MQQPKRSFKHRRQYKQHRRFRTLVIAVKPLFCQLNVIIAEVKPDELIKQTRRLAQLESLKIFRDARYRLVKAVQNPAVSKLQIRPFRFKRRVEALQIHQQKS